MFLNKKEYRTLDGKIFSIIHYRLTIKEYLWLKMCYILAIITCRRPADFMSADFEELLCGFVPDRHIVFQYYCGEVMEDDYDGENL